jgi:hypothetical protein
MFLRLKGVYPDPRGGVVPKGRNRRKPPPHLRALVIIYLTATTVRVGAFVTGVRNPKAFEVRMSGGDAYTFDSF